MGQVVVRTVADLMTREVVTVKSSDTLEHAAREMAIGAFRHLPVVDRHGKLVGLVSDRDLRSAVDPEGRVGGVMRTDLMTVGPATAAYQAAYLILRDKIGCLPVTDEDGTLLGLVTETDFVRVAFDLLSPRSSFDVLADEEERA